MAYSYHGLWDSKNRWDIKELIKNALYGCGYKCVSTGLANHVHAHMVPSPSTCNKEFFAKYFYSFLFFLKVKVIFEKVTFCIHFFFLVPFFHCISLGQIRQLDWFYR